MYIGRKEIKKYLCFLFVIFAVLFVTPFDAFALKGSTDCAGDVQQTTFMVWGGDTMPSGFESFYSDAELKVYKDNESLKKFQKKWSDALKDESLLAGWKYTKPLSCDKEKGCFFKCNSYSTTCKDGQKLKDCNMNVYTCEVGKKIEEEYRSYMENKICKGSNANTSSVSASQTANKRTQGTTAKSASTANKPSSASTGVSRAADGNNKKGVSSVNHCLMEWPEKNCEQHNECDKDPNSEWDNKRQECKPKGTLSSPAVKPATIDTDVKIDIKSKKVSNKDIKKAQKKQADDYKKSQQEDCKAAGNANWISGKCVCKDKRFTWNISEARCVIESDRPLIKACEDTEGGKWVYNSNGNVGTCVCPDADELWNRTVRRCMVEDYDEEERVSPTNVQKPETKKEKRQREKQEKKSQKEADKRQKDIDKANARALDSLNKQGKNKQDQKNKQEREQWEKDLEEQGKRLAAYKEDEEDDDWEPAINENNPIELPEVVVTAKDPNKKRDIPLLKTDPLPMATLPAKSNKDNNGKELAINENNPIELPEVVVTAEDPNKKRDVPLLKTDPLPMATLPADFNKNNSELAINEDNPVELPEVVVTAEDPNKNRDIPSLKTDPLPMATLPSNSNNNNDKFIRDFDILTLAFNEFKSKSCRTSAGAQ